MSTLAAEVEILTKYAAGLKGVEISLADLEGDGSNGQIGAAAEEVPSTAVSVKPVVKPLTVEERKRKEEEFLRSLKDKVNCGVQYRCHYCYHCRR